MATARRETTRGPTYFDSQSNKGYSIAKKYHLSTTLFALPLTGLLHIIKDSESATSE